MLIVKYYSSAATKHSERYNTEHPKERSPYSGPPLDSNKESSKKKR